MNRKKLYLYICISLVVGTQVTFHKNIAYAYDNKDFNRINTVNQKLNSTNLVSYTIDDSWIVIDSAATSEKSLNKVISDYIKDGKTKFYIKNGEYILDDGIIINSPGVIIQGESKENTRIIQNNSAINAITVTEDNAEISNLTIDSTQGRIAFSTSDDKKINKVNLHDCIIKGSPNVFAVAFYGTPYTNDVDDNNVVENNNLASGNIIENNEIYSESSGLEKDGMLFTKQKNGLINNNKIYGRRIAFYLSRDSKVTNNKIYDSSTNGIRCTVPAYYNEISGNTIDNPKASGICLVKNNGEVSEDYRASNITIKNNSISNSKYFGIEINNLEDSEISSNALSNIGFNGIYLISSNELNIHDNTIDNCNLFHGSDWEWDPALNSGILLDYNVKNSTLKSNTIKNDSDTCPYGINILPGRSNTYNTIINNTIEGYFIKGIDAQSKDPENTVVSANILNLIPGDLKAKTLDKNKIQLNWNNVYPVEGYNIYRSNSENGNYSKVNASPVISNGYIDMELEPGKTYYYKIAAVSQEGEEWTSSLSVSAETWPEAPIGLAAKSLDKSTIKLQWENIPGIEKYNIYSSDSETGEYQKIEANVTSNTYIDTDLEAGTTYYYKITYYYNGTYESAQSDSVSTITWPETPQELQANVDKSKNAINLSWNAVHGAESYNIYRAESDNGEYIKVNSLEVLETAYSDISVEPGKTYYYKITAVNQAGESEKSPAASASTLQETPIPALPAVPDTLTAEGTGKSSIRLSWNTVPGAESYNIYRTDSENGEYIKVNVSEITSNTYDDTGLEAGTTYYYKVTAVNQAGESEKSSAASAATLQETPIPALPAVPDTLTAEGLDKSSIKLNWNSVSNAGSYNVYRAVSENGEYVKVNVSGITSNSYDDTGLEAGTTYYYKVTAVNQAGESEKSPAASAATLQEIPIPALPAVPDTLTAEGTSTSSIRLSWSTVPGADSYNVYRADSENGTYEQAGANIASNSYDDTDLEAGKTYYYKVTAVNQAGESEKSSAASASTLQETPIPALPAVPSGLTAEDLDKSSIKLNWNTVPGADSYNVYRADSENGTYEQAGSNIASNTYDDTGLEAGKTYYYKVTAVNQAGESEKSSAASAATLQETPIPALPEVPSNLTAEGTSKSSIRLSWSTVPNADSYNVYRAVSENGTYEQAGSNIASNTYDDTGLEAGTTYYYKVTAVNQAGESDKSSAASAATKNTTKDNHNDDDRSPEIILKRIYGNDRIQTSIEIARELFKNKKPSAVVLASEANFPDALSGSVLAYKNNAPLLLVGKSIDDNREVLNYIISNLEKNRKIYILGGTAVVSMKMSYYLNEQGYNIVRLGGQDRYETNYKIIDSLNVAKNTPVVIVSGNNFGDSLGILNIACMKGYPILMSTENTLSDNTIKHIQSIQPDKVYIIGGNKILSSNLEDEIKKLDKNAHIARLGGIDRYETSVKIINEFILYSDTMTITSGMDFSYAVVGSLLAAKNNSNMLLVDNNNVKIQETLLKHEKIRNLIILGGKQVITTNTVNLFKKMISG